jgi:ParB-like chromosome segregation protein Spo0J
MPAGRPIKRDPAHNVELRAIETLIPYARNSRTHSPEQVAQIAASITEWGWTTPVLIDEAGMIIAGHGRVLAARKLGLTDVPVVVATDWTDAKKRAYVIADNKLALNAGWDNELLAVELADLRDVGFDVDLTGFGEDELASLVIDAEETDLPQLASGDREPLQQMTFTLHDEQAATVERAIKKAKEFGPFVDTGNENSNGNALARVCELFLGQHDDNS